MLGLFVRMAALCLHVRSKCAVVVCWQICVHCAVCIVLWLSQTVCGKNKLACVLCSAGKIKKYQVPYNRPNLAGSTLSVWARCHSFWQWNTFNQGKVHDAASPPLVALVVSTSHLMHGILLTSARSKPVSDPPDGWQLSSALISVKR